MRKVQIPKKSGGFRTVYVQGPNEKHRNRALAVELDALTDATAHADCLHGFRAGRSPVTNALAHVGFRFTLSMDIADFFDAVGVEQLIAAGGGFYATKATVDGAARQGLSSSPAAANLAGTLFDRDIIRALPPGAVYTRYADDLSISGNDKAALLALRDKIPGITWRHFFQIKQSKTRFQCADFGNRIICGVAVGATGIAVPRSVKRALRAARHKHPGTNKTRGLAEWCALKQPSQNTITRCQAASLHDKAKAAFTK